MDVLKTSANHQDLAELLFQICLASVHGEIRTYSAASGAQ